MLSLPNPPNGMWSGLLGATGWHADILLPVMNGSLCGPQIPPRPLMSLRKRLKFGSSWHTSPHRRSDPRGYFFLLVAAAHAASPGGLLLVQISGAFHQRGGFGAYAGAGESGNG